ncbi:branched-chain amino acid ABC transporter permease [Marinobacterium rhizophilum]|uniref:branched-chain amino acid ABC transporter permease n=1 Tax=Marinobacterium rhizophilum TaxID=420402 RepID=UPI000593E70D|nr:branched-chain amino acid ABC transporter permease [Marinobacterium rhizophilum]
MKGIIATIILLTGSVVTAFLLPHLKTPIILALSYGLAALGISVLMRAGQVSFGHAMYVCLAAYSVAFIAKAYPGIDGLVLIVCGVAISTIAGAIIGIFVSKYREIFFGMLNLAISMVLFAVIGKYYNITGGSDGMMISRPSFIGFELERDGFETLLLITTTVSILLVTYFIERFFNSPAGKFLCAIKTNETRLEYIGVSARFVFWKGYVISSSLCGLAGAIFALVQGLVTPEMGYWLKSGELVFISLLGGVAHSFGAIIGAMAFEFLKMYAAILMTDYWHMILGSTLILIIYFAPGGISGWLKNKKYI